MTNEIEKNLLLLHQKINNACKTFGRNMGQVNLVAVSKTVTEDKILQAINGGCKIFGENYVKEAQEKWPLIKEKFPQIKLHFIGHLQSNKTREALDLFDCIESLDSKKLAREFQKEIAKSAKNCEFFIQVNIGDEAQKSGIAVHAVKDFVSFAKHDCGLNVTGLMCIPPSNEAPSPYFALLAKMARENNLANISMGMSADFEDAIALGATHIRIGSAIFGARG